MFIVNLLGARLITDPEVKFLESGNAVCSMRVSVRVARKQKADEQYSPSEIVELNFWGAEFATKVGDAFRKGDVISCSGRLNQIQTYGTKAGGHGATAQVVVDQLAWPSKQNGHAAAHTPDEPEYVSSSDIAF